MKQFNPIDKVSELTEMLRAYNPIIHSKLDQGYAWLDEHSFCIEIPNPNADQSLFIAYEADVEFTISLSHYHSHYFANEEEYSSMCRQVLELLNNKCCAAAIFCGSENRWMGSTLIDKEKISLPIEELFAFVFKYDDYAKEMRENGAEARFVFWDVSLNRNIKF